MTKILYIRYESTDKSVSVRAELPNSYKPYKFDQTYQNKFEPNFFLIFQKFTIFIKIWLFTLKLVKNMFIFMINYLIYISLKKIFFACCIYNK